MKKELFIGEDLRTLQNNIKNGKSAENLIQRTDSKFVEINKVQSNTSKTAEKIVSEKSSEKITGEKSAETTNSPVSPELWQQMMGVETTGEDEERLF